MNITIRVFGRYKTIAGNEFIQLDITEGNTLRNVVDAFVKKYPMVEKDKYFMMVSKNKTYASIDTTIIDKDEITISPPVVSGG
jgi:molybdopterin converting factor small subunit